MSHTIPVRFDVLHAYAETHRLDYNELVRMVRDAIADGSDQWLSLLQRARMYVGRVRAYDVPDTEPIYGFLDELEAACEGKVLPARRSSVPACGNCEGPDCRCVGGMPAVTETARETGKLTHMPGVDHRAERFCAWLDDWNKTHSYAPDIGDAWDAAYRIAWKEGSGTDGQGENQ